MFMVAVPRRWCGMCRGMVRAGRCCRPTRCRSMSGVFRRGSQGSWLVLVACACAFGVEAVGVVVEFAPSAVATVRAVTRVLGVELVAHGVVLRNVCLVSHGQSWPSAAQTRLVSL